MCRLMPLALLSLLVFRIPSQAAPPSAALLPSNTKLHISVPDIFTLEKAWKKTKIAGLFDDPQLKPFFDGLEQKSILHKLGLDWQDLKSVAKGELGVAVIEEGPGLAAHVVTLNTNNDMAAMVKFLAKATAALEKQGYKTGRTHVGNFPVTTYVRAPRDNKERGETLFTVAKEDLLVAGDNEKAIAQILERWGGNFPDRLMISKAYQEILNRAQAHAKMPWEAFWFVEPIGLAEAERNPVRVPRRGPDLFKTLKGEGFTAFQGIGGFVSLAVGDKDIMHHTAIYAPEPYQKSMRMLKTLPGVNFAPPDWVPADVSRFTTLYLDVSTAFQNFGSFFDTFFAEGDSGTFNDILKGWRDDPYGPQVDVGKEIIGRLGDRVTLIGDTQQPIGPFSSGTLVGVNTKDEKGLAQAVLRFMQNDEDVKKHNIGNAVVWEMVVKEKKKKRGVKAAAPKPKGPNSALAVARGQLFYASDIRLLEKILAGKGTPLTAAKDFHEVVADLSKFETPKDCLRTFTRPDADFQTVYELARTHQLDKSNSLYARALVALFGDELKNMDAGKLPDYQNFRRYVGPHGTACVQQPGGWFMVGALLRKK